jgi:hypothetical protein
MRRQSCSGTRLSSRVVALSSPTEPRVTDVGHVEFTVLPVPPAAAVPVVPELEPNKCVEKESRQP